MGKYSFSVPFHPKHPNFGTPKRDNEHPSHFNLGVPRPHPGEMSQKLHDLLETITSLSEKNIADNV